MKRQSLIIILAICILALFTCVFVVLRPTKNIEITSLRCEYIQEPLGIDIKNPRLMWVNATNTSLQQTAYRILVATSPELLAQANPDLWDSGKITSDAQLVYYEGKELRSHTRYWWMVETWFGSRKIQSEPTWFETGKMNLSDWKAAWITDEHDMEYEPSPRFRKVFDASKEIASARCYISGLGYYDLFFNGKEITENTLNPGFTDYGKRILYVTYDVSEFIQPGENCIAVQLGNGWFNEQTPTVWNFHDAPWRKRPQLLCEIHLNYTDGTTEIIPTDTSWKTETGPLLFDNIHVGATFDARLKSNEWKPAIVTSSTAPLIEAQKMPLIATTETIHPIAVQKMNDTCYVFDMGENFAGVCKLEVKGTRGTRIMLRHAEMVLEDGNIDQRNISMHLRPRNPREIIQSDVYILEGEEVEEFISPFTYHGFRFVELTSDRPVDLNNIKLYGLRMHSDVKEIGTFNCSNELINQIFAICKNSYLSNLYGIPTDCPTREKNGWMADGFMVQEAGMLNYDSRNIYAKWVKDMTDAQEENGNVPGIVPTSWKWDSNWAGPIWDAAIFIVPSLLYNYTEDIESMKVIYPTAKRYLEYLKTIENEKGLLTQGLGDWLFYKAETSRDFMLSCYYYWDNILMAKMAELLGEKEDIKIYQDKAAQLKELINENYFHPENVSYANETQLSYALPLYMDIAPEEYKLRLAKELNEIIEANDFSLDFGFIGSLIVPEVLSEYGYSETMYQMLTKETMPSWGNWIKEHDATSLFETWDVNRNIGDASRNHPSMGAIAAWMYKNLAGINLDPETPGFKRLIIRPAFIKDLDFVEASYESQYGPVKVNWVRENGKITLKITIPATSTALLVLPDRKAMEIPGGEHSFQIR